MPFVKFDVEKEINKILAEDKELRALYEAALKECESQIKDEKENLLCEREKGK